MPTKVKMNLIRKWRKCRFYRIDDCSSMFFCFFLLFQSQMNVLQTQSLPVAQSNSNMPASVVQDIVQEEGQNSDLVPNLFPVHLNWNWYTIAPVTSTNIRELTQPISTTTQRSATQTTVSPSRSFGSGTSLRTTTSLQSSSTRAPYMETTTPTPKLNVTMAPFAGILNLLKSTSNTISQTTTFPLSSIGNRDEFSSSTSTTISLLTTSGADRTSTTRYPRTANPLENGPGLVTSVMITQNSNYLGITTPTTRVTKSVISFPSRFSSFLPISVTTTTKQPNIQPQVTSQTILQSSTAPSPDFRRSVNVTASPILEPRISMKISVPSTFTNLSDYQPYLEDRLSTLYHLAESRYDIIAGIFSYNSSLNFTLKQTDIANFPPEFFNISSNLRRNSSVQVVQLTWNNSSSSDQIIATVLFVVMTNATKLPNSEAMQRFRLLSDDEISGYLATNLLQSPDALLASDFGDFNGTTGNKTTEILPEVAVTTNSWSLLGAVVGISTVAVVLLSMVLVWLILFIYVKCTKKPTKTAQAPLVLTDNTEIIRIPLPASRQPLSVDHGMQTVILPRRSVLQSVNQFEERNATEQNGYAGVARERRDRGNVSVGEVYQETMYQTQYSYATGNALPDQARNNRTISPDENSVSVLSSPPPPKPPRMINEPQSFRNIRQKESDSSLVQKKSNEVATSTNNRVKLLSVVKTNRIDPSDNIAMNSLIELRERVYQERPNRERQSYLEKAAAQPDLNRTRNEGQSSSRKDKKMAEINDRKSRNLFQDQRFSVAGQDVEDDLSVQTNFIPIQNGDLQRRQPLKNAVPYEQTVQEIRREVRLWRRSQNSYSPNRYS